MLVGGRPYRTIWYARGAVEVIDQTRLPHEFTSRRLCGVEDAADAIRTMVVRGAPLIGATAAYGIALALRVDASDRSLRDAAAMLLATRPTAVNLRWAVDRVVNDASARPPAERPEAALELASEMCDEDALTNQAIGVQGAPLLEALCREKGERINVLTHCNAGWLATVDWGTALSPVYTVHDRGLPVHVWVDETRPRNQGALTAWELQQQGVLHTVIVDNAGGHLMQRGLVDCCIVGSDRTTATGDVCNKIGTYLKAAAARDNGVPFYVALPTSTIDWSIDDGRDIPIEQRDASEVTHVTGLDAAGNESTLQILPDGSDVANYAFDVTPGHLVTGLITEQGVCEASRAGLVSLREQPAPNP